MYRWLLFYELHCTIGIYFAEKLDSRLPATRGGIPLLSIRIHVLVNIIIIAFESKSLKIYYQCPGGIS